ncbi:MAG: 5-formyltetrahydrofolate cyclo-ligase [Verrucomicrobiota bacterium]
MIPEEKVKLRTELQNSLRTFSVASRHQASSKIQHHLYRSDLWKQNRVILLFSALPGEPRTVEILREAISQEKVCAYPKVQPLKGEMKLYQVKSVERLVRGSFGILEPDTANCDPLEFRDIQMALIPGLGYDRTGNRLGRGYAYYDRFLSKEEFSGATIGCHFRCQLVDKIPVEAHDKSVDYLLNETGFSPVDTESLRS